MLRSITYELRERYRDRRTYFILLIGCVSAALLFPPPQSGLAPFMIGGVNVAMSFAPAALALGVIFGSVLLVIGTAVASNSLESDFRTGLEVWRATSPRRSITLVFQRWCAQVAFLLTLVTASGLTFACLLMLRKTPGSAMDFAVVFLLVALPLLPWLATAGLIIDNFAARLRWLRPLFIVTLLLTVISAGPSGGPIDPLASGELVRQASTTFRTDAIDFGIGPIRHPGALRWNALELSPKFVLQRVLFGLAGVLSWPVACLAFARSRRQRNRFVSVHVVEGELHRAGALIAPVRLAAPLARFLGELRLMMRPDREMVWPVLVAAASAIAMLAKSPGIACSLMALIPIFLANRMIIVESPHDTDSLLVSILGCAREYPWRKGAVLAACTLLLDIPALIAGPHDPGLFLSVAAYAMCASGSLVGISYVIQSELPGAISVTLYWYLCVFGSFPPALDIIGAHAPVPWQSSSLSILATVFVLLVVSVRGWRFARRSRA